MSEKLQELYWWSTVPVINIKYLKRTIKMNQQVSRNTHMVLLCKKPLGIFKQCNKRQSTDLEIQPQYTKWEAGIEGYQRPAWQRRSLG